MYGFNLQNPLKYVDPDGKNPNIHPVALGCAMTGSTCVEETQAYNAATASAARAVGSWIAKETLPGRVATALVEGRPVDAGSEIVLAIASKGKGKGGGAGIKPLSAGAKPGATARGGTYKLRDPNTNRVRRTGQTNDLNRRQKEHGRAKETKDLDFKVDRRSDDPTARRGREQNIYDEHPEADLNKRQPISPDNPRRDEYLKAGETLE